MTVLAGLKPECIARLSYHTSYLQFIGTQKLEHRVIVSISNAAIFDIRSGQLFGAAGVDVDGVLYDVAFRDGTAIELYGGADENTDFPFTNLSNLNDNSLAITANQALLDQVFVDSPLGAFDSAPNLTNGCLSTGDAMSLHLWG